MAADATWDAGPFVAPRLFTRTGARRLASTSVEASRHQSRSASPIQRMLVTLGRSRQRDERPDGKATGRTLEQARATVRGANRRRICRPPPRPRDQRLPERAAEVA